MIEFILRTMVILIGLAGFLLAGYIRHKKKKNKPLVCPLKSNCDTVINSDYSSFCGIRLEILGMIYYAFIAIGYGVANNFSELNTVVSDLMLPFSFFAFLFSIYLISVQAFVLRQWCAWCLCSAFFCTLIFTLSFLAKVGM